MLTPTDFENKLNELRKIERRMQRYDHHTPISRVLDEQKTAQTIYNQLADTIKEIGHGS